MNHLSQAPCRFTCKIPGGSLAGWRWRNDTAPPLLFLHATGFCASAYKQMLSAASHAYDIYAIDLRGHGLTQLPTDPNRLTSWAIYVGDIVNFLNQESRDDWTLAGHSMGAVVAALAGAGRSDIARTHLIEPVVLPRVFRYLAMTPFWRPYAMARPPASLARRRRTEWPDRVAIMSSYGRKPLFRRFSPGAIADYLEDGVVADGTGVRLSCAPDWEAATFVAQDNDFHGALRAAPGPVSILAANHLSSTVAPGFGMILRGLNARFKRIDGVGHLLAMEDPLTAGQFLVNGLP